MMRAGRIEKANALAVQISKEITYRNKSRLSGLSHKTDAKSVWKAVRQVTGTEHSVTVADGISAESLNDHFANQLIRITLTQNLGLPAQTKTRNLFQSGLFSKCLS